MSPRLALNLRLAVWFLVAWRLNCILPLVWHDVVSTFVLVSAVLDRNFCKLIRVLEGKREAIPDEPRGDPVVRAAADTPRVGASPRDRRRAMVARAPGRAL